MVWKSERQRSVTFRKRIPRRLVGGLTLEGPRGSNPRILACTAIIVPAWSDGELGPANNWVVLVRNEIIARARQRVVDRMRSAQDEGDDGPKQ